MKLSAEYTDEIRKLNLRIDDLEKIIKLVLINNLIDETDEALAFNDSDEDKYKEIEIIAQKYKTVFGGLQTINGME